jgi:hypothetical protein
LGYTATDQNIIYLDLDSGVVKRSHHAQFDEAWYLQDTRPPAAQLLYDLGITDDTDVYAALGLTDSDEVDSDFRPPGTIEALTVPWPPDAPCPPKSACWTVPDACMMLPLPLLHTPLIVPERRQIGARAAYAQATAPPVRRSRMPRARDIMMDFGISRDDMAMIYMSPDPYFDAFEEILHLKHVNLDKHATAGLSLFASNGRVHLASVSPSTPAAKIPDWRTRVRGAWLIKVADKRISTIDDARSAIRSAVESGTPSVSLLFGTRK